MEGKYWHWTNRTHNTYSQILVANSTNESVHTSAKLLFQLRQFQHVALNKMASKILAQLIEQERMALHVGLHPDSGVLRVRQVKSSARSHLKRKTSLRFSRAATRNGPR